MGYDQSLTYLAQVLLPTFAAVRHTFRQARGSELLPGAAHHRCQIDDEGPAATSCSIWPWSYSRRGISECITKFVSFANEGSRNMEKGIQRDRPWT